MLNLDEADFESTIELFLYSVRTVHVILIFPFNGLFPFKTKGKNFNFVYWNNSDVVKDKNLIFWPWELKELSLGRPNDFIIGNKKTTTVTYLEEIKGILLNLFPDSVDFCLKMLVSDIHWPRVKRDLIQIFKDIGRKRNVGVLLFIVKISPEIGSLLYYKKIILTLIEIFKFLFSYILWRWYFNLSLKRGGLK
jgi:hypothetical protein